MEKNNPNSMCMSNYPTIGEWFHMSEDERWEALSITQNINKVYKEVDRAAKSKDSYKLIMNMFDAYHKACEYKAQMQDASGGEYIESHEAFITAKRTCEISSLKLRDIMVNNVENMLITGVENMLITGQAVWVRGVAV